jgi:hypothetical protein
MKGFRFEKVLKETKSSIFVRNIQLSLFCIPPGLYFGGNLIT